MENKTETGLIDVFVVYKPEVKDSNNKVVTEPRENYSYHHSNRSALFGQKVLLVKTSIEPRCGIVGPDGRIFLVDKNSEHGLIMADEEILRKKVAESAISQMDNATRLALNLEIAQEEILENPSNTDE